MPPPKKLAIPLIDEYLSPFKQDPVATESLRYVLNERNEAQRVKDTYNHNETPIPFLPITSHKDNAPMESSGNYGIFGKNSFYFQQTPNVNELWFQSHNSPLGFKICYGVGSDTYMNEFMLEFPDNRFDAEKMREINNDIHVHLTEIGYYKECAKRLGFTREQGEALLNIYREGDGAEIYQTIGEPSEINYDAFSTEANYTKKIIRVEAINRYDYQVPSWGAQGRAMYYYAAFWKPNNNKQYYHIHPSRCIRSRHLNISYSFWDQQSALRPCFSELQILNNLERANGYAAHRWAIGIPIIMTKGISAKNQDWFKGVVGNPAMDDWLSLPSEYVTSCEMMGAGGSVLDIRGMMETMIEQIACSVQIPVPILMEREAGVLTGGVINEKQYFSTLVREQCAENEYHYQFINLDPFFTELFEKNDIKPGHFKLNWGLRQEMSLEEKAEFDMKRASVAVQEMNFKEMDEIRESYGLPKIENTPFGKYCELLTGYKAEVIGSLPPNFGQFKQAFLRELISGENPNDPKNQGSEAPPGESNSEQLQSEQNKPINVERNTVAESGNKEMERRNYKAMRQGAGGEQSKENSLDSLRNILTEVSKEDLMDELYELYKDKSITSIAKKAKRNPEQVKHIISILREDHVKIHQPIEEDEEQNEADTDNGPEETEDM